MTVKSTIVLNCSYLSDERSSSLLFMATVVLDYILRVLLHQVQRTTANTVVRNSITGYCIQLAKARVLHSRM